VAGGTTVLSFGALSDRHAQLRQVVQRLAMETLVHRNAELKRDPICQCHVENDELFRPRSYFLVPPIQCQVSMDSSNRRSQ